MLADWSISRENIGNGHGPSGQGGIGVLMPLYLVNVHRMGPALLGVFLIISSAAMTLIVRFGGQVRSFSEPLVGDDWDVRAVDGDAVFCPFVRTRRVPEGVYGACDISRFGDACGIWVAGKEVEIGLKERKVLVVIAAWC